MSGRRARQVGAEAARVRDREVDAVEREPHRVGHDVADQRLAQPPVGPPARVGARDRRGSTSPICVLKIGASSAFSSSIFAWIAGSGVTPMSHGLWKSAVL